MIGLSMDGLDGWCVCFVIICHLGVIREYIHLSYNFRVLLLLSP